MTTDWDAETYDRVSGPQQEWAAAVLDRVAGRIRSDATVLDVGCGTGRVTEALFALVPDGRVLAIDASQEMVDLARERLGSRARVWRQDVLDLAIDEPVDVVVSTATLHWVPDHDRLWPRLAAALRSGGILEVQCGGQGNIDRVREVIDAVAAESFPELVGWSPWVFAGPQETQARLQAAGRPRRLRALVDPARASGTPRAGAPRAVHRRCPRARARTAGLRPPQRLGHEVLARRSRNSLVRSDGAGPRGTSRRRR
jgi:trans-aconitate 2-methyltransferase